MSAKQKEDDMGVPDPSAEPKPSGRKPRAPKKIDDKVDKLISDLEKIMDDDQTPNAAQPQLIEAMTQLKAGKFVIAANK